MDKLRDISTMLDGAGKPIPIQLDGGVGPDNTAEVTAAGASILVAGSAIFQNPPYKDVIDRMKATGK
jgi:ribulose-phosphate 3-epimerase